MLFREACPQAAQGTYPNPTIHGVSPIELHETFLCVNTFRIALHIQTHQSQQHRLLATVTPHSPPQLWKKMDLGVSVMPKPPSHGETDQPCCFSSQVDWQENMPGNALSVQEAPRQG